MGTNDFSDIRHLIEKGDDAYDLAKASLMLAAHDLPSIDLGPYYRHLQSLYAEVEDWAKRDSVDLQEVTAAQMAQVLASVLSEVFRYRGDEETYDDLDNTNLIRVIDRRKGLPVTLGILFIAAARAQGWSAAGLNFPGHFLVRLESLDGNRAIIDPFHGGSVLETPDLRNLLKVVSGPADELESQHYRSVSNKDILMRLQNNVKMRQLDRGQMTEALETLESMQAIFPDSAALCREAGLLHLRLGQMSQALRALETYLSRAPNGPERSRIDSVVQDLKQRVH